MTDTLPSCFRLDDIEVDTTLRHVHRAQTRLDVSDLSFDLLVALAMRHPEPMDAGEMATTVWQAGHVSEETIAQRVALLRRALGDDARRPCYIRTLRHRGYALIPAPQASAPASVPRPSPLPLLLGGTVLIVLAVIALVFLWPGSRPSEPDQGADRNAPGDMTHTIRLDRARNLLDLHQPAATETAIEILEAAQAEHPDDRATRLTLSFALTTRATKFTVRPNDVDRAEALARDLIAEDENTGTAWHALAYALDARGRLDEALAAYQQAYTLDPADVAAMSSAAYLLRVRGRLHDALVLEARALGDGHPTLYGPVQIATALSLLDHPAAEIWWPRALTGGAGETVTLAARMEADLRAGQPLDALARLVDVDADIGETARLQLLAGLAHLRHGDHEAAALALDAADDMALPEQLALAAMHGEPGDEALLDSMIGEALADGQSWPDLRIRIAAIDTQSGRVTLAARRVGQAIDLGWRDARWIETSPFFAPLVASEAWPPLRNRIEREIAAQRRLVDTDPGLASLLDDAG